MILLFLFVLMIALAIIVPKMIPNPLVKNNFGNKNTINTKWIRFGVSSVFATLAGIFFLMTSCFIIGPNEVGHPTRIYMGISMPQGRIIAAPNEKGPQAKIFPPGFHMIPFIAVTHDIEELPLVHIKEGSYGFVVAKDGNAMPVGQFIAPAWESANDMIDAMKFMGYDEEGNGKPRGIKGPQLTVLPPGDYRINRYLFDVFGEKSTPVPAGHVAVVKSNVGEDYKGTPLLPTGIKTTELSVPIVPKGYRGVWKDVMNPGEYYINKKAYDVTIVDTRVQTWKYLGGYQAPSGVCGC